MRDLDGRSAAVVALGGVVGASLRWGLAETWSGDGFPWATLAANVIGCAVLGALGPGTRARTRALVGVGFCGGLTTFSTFAVELAVFAEDGRLAMGVTSLVVSVAAGVGAVVIARTVVGRGPTRTARA